MAKHTDKLVHLNPGVRELLAAAQKVVEVEASDEHKSLLSAAVVELKQALGNFAMGDIRQPFARDPRQHGGI